MTNENKQEHTLEALIAAHIDTIDEALQSIEEIKEAVRGGAKQADVLQALTFFGAQLEKTRAAVSQ